MKLNIVASALLISFLGSFARAATYDLLAQEKINIRASNSSVVLDRTLGNIKAIFERYKPQIDSSTQIVSPLVVGGTADHPVVKLSLRKCVAFICKTVDLDAEFSTRDVSGSCERNSILLADLSRSSDTLTDVYESFEVLICYKKTSADLATLDLVARAKHARDYSSGIVQRQIFDILKMQISPIVKAVKETLESNK